jgi:hypothetical protein
MGFVNRKLRSREVEESMPGTISTKPGDLEPIQARQAQLLAEAVNHQGRSVYPAFQFDEEGRPRPVVADVLATLGQQSQGWELALWFTSVNGWVDGRRPVDLLSSEPAEVALAAEREAEGLFF